MSRGLDGVPTYTDPIFGLAVPTTCPGVPETILYPKKTWAEDTGFDRAARELAARFRETFAKYAPNVDPEVRAAEPGG
jgi:phosphoenolpyruvate carboxykinase (ATP)